VGAKNNRELLQETDPVVRTSVLQAMQLLFAPRRGKENTLLQQGDLRAEFPPMKQ